MKRKKLTAIFASSFKYKDPVRRSSITGLYISTFVSISLPCRCKCHCMCECARIGLHAHGSACTQVCMHTGLHAHGSARSRVCMHGLAHTGLHVHVHMCACLCVSVISACMCGLTTADLQCTLSAQHLDPPAQATPAGPGPQPALLQWPHLPVSGPLHAGHKASSCIHPC